MGPGLLVEKFSCGVAIWAFGKVFFSWACFLNWSSMVAGDICVVDSTGKISHGRLETKW